MQRFHYTHDTALVIASETQDVVPHHKPDGLWYSCGDEWKMWMMYEMRDWWNSKKYRYKLHINRNKILHLNTPLKLHEFTIAYGIQQYQHMPHYVMINWEQVAEHWGGIEISPVISRISQATMTWYSTWDIASGCIWDASIVSIGKMQKIAHKREWLVHNLRHERRYPGNG